MGVKWPLTMLAESLIACQGGALIQQKVKLVMKVTTDFEETAACMYDADMQDCLLEP